MLHSGTHQRVVIEPKFGIFQQPTLLDDNVSCDDGVVRSFPGARAEEFHNRNAGLPKMPLGRREDEIGREKFTSKMIQPKNGHKPELEGLHHLPKEGIPPQMMFVLPPGTTIFFLV